MGGGGQDPTGARNELPSSSKQGQPPIFLHAPPRDKECHAIPSLKMARGTKKLAEPFPSPHDPLGGMPRSLLPRVPISPL